VQLRLPVPPTAVQLRTSCSFWARFYAVTRDTLFEIQDLNEGGVFKSFFIAFISIKIGGFKFFFISFFTKDLYKVFC